MNVSRLIALGAFVALATAWGCGSSDSSSDGGGGSPGTGGSATGGTGGSDTGGTGGSATGGTGGSDTGGTGGSATGGTGGSDTGGTGGGATGGTGGSATGGTGGSATGGTGGSATGGTGGGGTGGGGTGGGGTGGGGTGGGGTGGGGTGGGSSFWDGPYDPNALPNPADGKHNAGKNCLQCHTGSPTPAWLFAGTVYQTGGGGAAHVQVGVKDANGLYTTYSATNGNFWYPKGSATVDWANAEVRARNANGEIIMSGSPSAGCNSCHTGANQLVAP
jgi:hypothetical protein